MWIPFLPLPAIAALTLAALVVTHQLRNPIHRWGWRRLPLRRLVPRVAAASLLSGVVISAAAAPWVVPQVPPGNLWLAVFAFFSTFAGISLGWFVIYFAYHFRERVREAEAELRRLLKAHPEVEVLGEAADADEARAAIAALAPDLIFLDIEMPGGSGFDLLASLDAVPLVIFTTAFDEYALRAFEVSALDYLVKPIEPARLEQAVERVRRMPLPEPGSASGPVLSAGHRVFVRDGDRCWFIRLDRISIIEAEAGYARVHFEGQKPLVSRSLAQLEAKLDPEIFFRVNRSQIINLNTVRAIKPWFKGRLRAELEGGLEVTMSRRRAAAFQERMGM